jgi:hypothetical protein
MSNVWKIKKKVSKGNIIALVLIAILAIFFISLPSLAIILSGTEIGYNPGFPGAKVGIEGLTFGDLNGWQGTNVFHYVSNRATEPYLVFHQGTGYSYDKIYWGASSGTSGVNIIWDTNSFVGNVAIDRQQLDIEVQRDVPIEDFPYQNWGEKLSFLNGTIINDPNTGKIVQYWHLSSEKISATETRYNLTKQEYMLVPGNFHISFWIPPGNDYARHDSGWQEGTWSDIEVRFALYWHEWLNDLGPILQNDQVPPEIPANATAEQIGWTLRGGFPIAGWIQRYSMLINTPSGQTYDLFKWTTSDGQNFGSIGLDANLVSNLKALVQFIPSLEGRVLDLYDTPTETSPGLSLTNLEGSQIDNRANAVTPSPEITPTQYFTIALNELGTYAQSLGLFQGWRVYYPAVDFFIRVIFGVYGQHSYLWTEKTSEENQYPGWQNRTVETTYTPGPLTGLLAWFSNPFNLLWLFFILIIAVIVIVTIFNPGLWASVAISLKKSGGSKT